MASSNPDIFDYDKKGHMNINKYTRKIINKRYRCIWFNHTDFNWEKVIIEYGDESFIVYLTKDHPKYEYVIKPSKKYATFQFSGLFEFGAKSRYYREDKMVALIPQKFYKI